jgi:hypothetical protein
MSAESSQPLPAEETAKLIDLTDRLRSAGAPHAARRLSAIDQNMDELEYSELIRLVGPERVAGELKRSARFRVSVLRTVRNGMVFLPLLWVWVVLGLATERYRQLLIRSPGFARESFIALWQRGFYGGFITFEEASLIAAVMIIVLAALTVWLTWVDSRNERLQAEAVDELDELMTRISLRISQRSYTAGSSAMREDYATALAHNIDDLALVAKELMSGQRQAAEYQELLTRALSTNNSISEAVVRALSSLAGEQARLTDTLDRLASPPQDAGRADAAVNVPDDYVREATLGALARLTASIDDLSLRQQDLSREFAMFRQAPSTVATDVDASPVVQQQTDSFLPSSPFPLHRRSLPQAFIDGVGGVFDIFGRIRKSSLSFSPIEDSLVADARSLCAALGLLPNSNGHEDGSR